MWRQGCMRIWPSSRTALQEFVMDFIQVMPGMPKAKVRSRVVMSPHHVKRLLGALAENVQRFEKQHGPIKDHGAADPGMPLPYMGPQGQA